VSLSMTTERASMPVAFRLHLPEPWVHDRQRRKKDGRTGLDSVSDETGYGSGPDPACTRARHPSSFNFVTQ
jgi:hypothetical protein